MYQLEMEYFFPLREQSTLDLDFTSSIEFAKLKREELLKNSVLYAGIGGYTFATTGPAAGWTTSYVIDLDHSPLTVKSKAKPNFIARYIYKTLGIKWKSNS